MNSVERPLRRVSKHAAVLGLLAVVIAFSLTADGPLTGDDHYSLWAAQSLWVGDLPNRDFYDPGSPLQTLLSYVGQLATGHRPIGEILIAVAFRTLGILCVYLLSLRAAGHRGIALLVAAIVSVMSLPEGIYSSDKLLLYPLTALVAWRYLDTRQSVAPLALLTAAAFLLRHDHVLYVGAPLLLAILVAPRSPVAFVLMTIGLLLPWMAWVEWNEGLITYFTTRVSFAGALGLGTRRAGFGLADGSSLLSQENAQRLVWPLGLITTATAVLLAAWARERRLIPLAFTAVLLESGILLGYGSYPAAAQIAALWLPLGGWMASRARRPITVTLSAAFAIVVIAIVVSATNATDLVPRIAFGGGGLRQRVRNTFRVQSTLPPIDIYSPPGTRDDRLVVRYVHDCLDPDDRVWETSDWFSLPYQSERAVVEHPYWSLGFRRELDAEFASSLPNRPMPPLIVVRDVPDPLQAFRHYPVTQALVRREYEPITSARFEQFRADVEDVQLLRHRDREATGTFAPLDLPCFRQSR